ncbi:MAG: hypothetical protein IT327_02020 [Anaerolineae bacterium]|nr:hypothetical protein [Anaerolineae bacterium]
MMQSAMDAAFAALQITLLGSPQIACRDKPSDLAGRQARDTALLPSLRARARRSRDHLAFLFWPDLPNPDDGNNRANSALGLFWLTRVTFHLLKKEGMKIPSAKDPKANVLHQPTYSYTVAINCIKTNWLLKNV